VKKIIWDCKALSTAIVSNKLELIGFVY